MTIYHFLIVFISIQFMTSVQAEMVDMNWLKDQATLLNKRASWKLFGQDADRGRIEWVDWTIRW